ncbi:MAG: chemotaxis protein CheA [Rhodobacterales bacterium]|nr:chemotaxis protein CheA [Puniceibacterium antarcticum]
MSGQQSIRDTFFEECEELLEALVEGLAEMEDPDHSKETVNAVFRAVHSIKGGAGAFGLDELVHFAHTFETVLDKVRSDTLEADPDLLKLFQRSGDQLANLVEAARDDKDPNRDAQAVVLGELQKYLGAEDAEEEIVFDAMGLDFGAELVLPDLLDIEDTSDSSESADSSDGQSSLKIAIRFAPKRSLFENGHEPLLLFDAIAELGTLTVSADTSAIPAFAAFDPAEPGIIWKLTLETSESETVLHEVFEFVDSLCDIDIKVQQQEKQSAAPSETIEAEQPKAQAAPDVPEASAAPEAPEMSPERPARGPVKQPAPSSSAASAPANTAAAADRDHRGPKPTLRVDLDRVDRLINTVGELIINQAMIVQRIEELDLPSGANLTNELEAYKLLARDIQEGVMAIRAQPVKPLFQRMSRIVREASDATGKNARMVTVGDATEVDKTVIERLADPLTHMVRNAVDHGLESPEKRRAMGKDEIGTIRMSAAHRSGSVFIEIGDDGAGLNRPRILETAIKKGLIAPDAELSETEIDNLLFLPGFSTAAEVSALSGRGVGMDVVKNAVQALGGRVSITSTPGRGTTFTIILPLTLAVMDGFVISVAQETMVIPIASILETITPHARDLHRIGMYGEVLRVRGRYVPIVDVAQNLGLQRNVDTNGNGVLLLVETEMQELNALRVDAIHDQRQVVIKSLESNYGRIPGVSAATILGDGKIALILDPEELVKLNSDDVAPMPIIANQEDLHHAFHS